MKPFTTIAAVLFGIAALGHLARLLRGFTIVVNGHLVPQWASVVGLIVSGILAVTLWREASSRRF